MQASDPVTLHLLNPISIGFDR